MDRSTTPAADRSRVTESLWTTQEQQAFRAADCHLSAGATGTSQPFSPVAAE